MDSNEEIIQETLPEKIQEQSQEPPKKQLSENRLNKLKLARERASQVAKEKREQKQEREKKQKSEPLPVVVVEQSDSDEDEFEGPPGVLFVRRKRNKPKSDELKMNILYAQMFGIPRSF